jgi:hypothetical protein
MSVLRSLALLLALAPAAAVAAGTAPLTVQTADGRAIAFTVEVAKTHEELERGLMNRSSLAADAGMLFDFSQDRPVTMWMENTLIPLDMLFVTADGRIAGIAARTVPLSREVIPSPGPIRAVIELNGGTAERDKIHVGDHVSVPVPVFSR